ncbi:MAG: lantibiotic dehydratase [Anaerolineales bacterium]|nr:lantibiotic dehydratase [Anaerolineales bacterium]
MTQLFPHTLVRVGGAPFTHLERLKAATSADIARQIAICQQQQQALKPDISKALYTIIGQASLPDIRQRLIQLRRDLFNDRPQAIEMIVELEAYLPQDVSQLLQDYKTACSQVAYLHERGQQSFPQEVADIQAELKALVQEESFQKGLLLSSQSLLKHGLPRYLASGSAQVSKQAIKTKRSLLQYLTRMAAKTTPFSTFTNLAIISDDGKRPFSSDIQSHIRLNNGLYQYLKALLLKYEPVYRHILIRPNPTLSKEQGQYIFLVNSYNIESFQRLPIQPILDWIVSLVTEQQEGIPFQTLVQTMLDSGQLEASELELASYLNQLIEYGFLEFDMGVSGIDPDWDLSLCAWLEQLPGDIPHLQELLEVLRDIRQLAVQYSTASLAGRQQCLQDAYEQVKAICYRIHEAAGLPADERLPLQEREKALAATVGANADTHDETAFKRQAATYFYFRPENLFYEDTTREVMPSVDEAQLADVTNSLHTLFTEVSPFDWSLPEREKMLHYYHRRFGTATAVNLLTFYEAYYRDVKKPEADMQEAGVGQHSDPFMSEVSTQVERRKAKIDAWKSHFSNTLGQIDAVVQLTPGQITQSVRAASLSSQNVQPLPNSYGAFVQLFSGSEQDPSLQAVVNAPLPGYGKLMSRFLHLFDQKVITEVRHWNQSINQDAIFAEIADASYFNANLHPPLLTQELRLPNGHNNLPPDCQISVTECQVQIAPDQQALQLVHRQTGQCVFPFDLGFQSLNGRSQLFKLLLQFTYAALPTFGPVLQVINEQAKAQAADETAVCLRPRVVYDNRLVLQRQAWIVPQKALPLMQTDEDEWQYFTRINQWRCALGLPDEVFIFLVNRQEMANQDTKSNSSTRGDHYKPQYIHFDNPLLVELFSHLLPKVQTALTIEEMLPGSQQLWQIDGQPHVMEYLLQWQG